MSIQSSHWFTSQVATLVKIAYVRFWLKADISAQAGSGLGHFGSLYFALEELSYGQHMFRWETGKTWSELNDQQETNLHNVLPLFDQLPRTLLTLGVLIGGIIMPLYRSFRKITLDESNRFYRSLD